MREGTRVSLVSDSDLPNGREDRFDTDRDPLFRSPHSVEQDVSEQESYYSSSRPSLSLLLSFVASTPTLTPCLPLCSPFFLPSLNYPLPFHSLRRRSPRSSTYQIETQTQTLDLDLLDGDDDHQRREKGEGEEASGETETCTCCEETSDGADFDREFLFEEVRRRREGGLFLSLLGSLYDTPWFLCSRDENELQNPRQKKRGLDTELSCP